MEFRSYLHGFLTFEGSIPHLIPHSSAKPYELRPIQAICVGRAAPSQVVSVTVEISGSYALTYALPAQNVRVR